MKIKILGIALIAIFALPTVALGGSFVTSLIQGKTPAEAITIIAEQVDTLFGRVAVLEQEQSETSEDIERLKLENENLRLKNESLFIQSEITAQAVEKNKGAVDAVNQCLPIDKQMTCLNNAIANNQSRILLTDLHLNTSIEEVIRIEYNNSWYPKHSTDEICIEPEDNPRHRCVTRTQAIQAINEDRKQARESSQYELERDTKSLNDLKGKFNSLKCEAILNEYAPNRGPYGCG
jgi:ABC-type phosphate transport system auxiliary subunit